MSATDLRTWVCGMIGASPQTLYFYRFPLTHLSLPPRPSSTGPCCHFCHVKIPSPWIDVVENKQPATEKEHELLEEHWQEEASANSRLGCQVTLTKNLDGIQVFIPDGPPADCP